MSIRHTDLNNNIVTMYTDGTCFTNALNINIGKKLLNTKNNTSMFSISEGIWRFPFDFRLCVYTAEEILNNCLLDITDKITIYADTFFYMETEITVPPMIKGMLTEYYYDVTFLTQKQLIELLQKDISLSYKGNLSNWKTSIELIDLVFK